MMRRSLKWLSLCMMLLCMNLLFISVKASDGVQSLPTMTSVHINPLYQDVISENDLVQPNPYAAAPIEVEYVSETEAVVQLREQAVQRAETIVLSFTTVVEESDIITGNSETRTEELKALMNQLWDKAVAHTGNSVEGDYLKWQYAGWTCSVNGVIYSTKYDLTFTYTLTYYTTAEQEAVVTEKVNEVLAYLALTDPEKNAYQKIELIYHYICSTVSYDKESTTKLKHSAYAALINETAVCQGYALLFYRLALECDIDTRLIAGEGGGDAHGWNIVQIDGEYYNLDTTWDAGKDTYDYFLKTENDFPNHIRYPEYDTAEFHATYPMVHSHVEVVDEAVEVTCTSVGLTEGSHCSICKGVMVEQEVVAALGHAEVTDEAVEATCTETGLTEGKHCTRCNEVLVEREVTDPLGHEEVTDKAVEATCTETGLTEGKHCSRCDEMFVEQRVVAALGHAEVIDEAVEATCTETGLTEGKHCSRCNEVFVEQEVVSVTDHTPNEAVIENEAVAKCETDATYDSVIYCSECGTELSRETVTVKDSATGHTEVIDQAVAPTCTTAGLTEGKHCSVCNEILVAQKEVEKIAHSEAEAVTENEVAAKCETDTTYDSVIYCSECGTELSRETVTVKDSATGHTEVIDQAVAATETNTGLTAGSHCGKCNKVLTAQQVIPRLERQPVTETPAPEVPATEPSEPEIPDTQAPVKAEAGDTIFDAQASYTVNSDGKTAAFTGITADATNVVIPKTISSAGVTYKVTAVADKAFANNTKLKSVTVGDYVTVIGANAFSGCKNLTTVKIGKRVKTIGQKAFYNCKKLKTLSIGSKVQKIGTKAFMNCTSLSKITIPSAVKEIGNQAFYNCKKLKTITIKSKKLTIKNVGSKAFGKTYVKAKIKVPKSKLNAYKTLLSKRGVSKKAKISK